MYIEIIKREVDKQRLIEDCSNKKIELQFLYDENPNEIFNFSIETHKIDVNRFIVFPPYTHSELDKWLHYGNWQAIDSIEKNIKFIDTFRSSENEIKNHMIENEIELIIDSFHDDVEWKIVKR